MSKLQPAARQVMAYPTCRPTDEAKQRMGALLADVLALPAAPAAAPVDGGEVRG